MRFLRQSTAQTERIGPYLDATDGVTEETALTPATEISKNNAAFSPGPTGSHDAEGWYLVNLSGTHLDTLGSFILKSHDGANHLPVWHEFMVLPADVYNSLVLGTDTLPTDVTQWLGNAAATPTVAGVPEVDVTHWLGTASAPTSIAGVPEVDITHLGGVLQSAIDLKDFADFGYEPITNKVQGVVLVDTTTTNTDMVAAAPTADVNADALLDRTNAIETGLTLRQAQRLIAAASAGKLSGAATTTIVIRNAVQDSKARITATVDPDGNRSAITSDVT